MRKQIKLYEQSTQKYRDELNKKLNKEKSSFEKNYDNINLLSYEGIAQGGFKTSTGRYD